MKRRSDIAEGEPAMVKIRPLVGLLWNCDVYFKVGRE